MKPCISIVSVLLVSFFVSLPPAEAADRVQIKADFSEAEAVLAILSKRSAGQPISDGDWNAIFVSEPYVRLKKREAAMQRSFSDDDFKKFVLSDNLLQRQTLLTQTLAEWKQADLRASAQRILPYLPAEAVVRAKVYPVIKPLHNSFVFEPGSDPAIFLYLDPAQTRSTFENTVAHEMHHIGLSSVSKEYDKKIEMLSSAAHKVAGWMGAFGEGQAMLAAAGGPDVYPVGDPTPELKENWARGMRDFNQDLNKVNDFFLATLNGKLEGGAVDQRGYEFFGLQGPWYTVGYRMAVMVEKRYGRAALIECMRDPRLLLSRYNAAAQELNKSGQGNLALWSEQVLQATQAGKTGQ